MKAVGQSQAAMRQCCLNGQYRAAAFSRVCGSTPNGRCRWNTCWIGARLSIHGPVAGLVMRRWVTNEGLASGFAPFDGRGILNLENPTLSSRERNEADYS